MRRRLSIFFLILCGTFLSFSSALSGTILSSYKYAWGNNVGYINFENVVVDDSALSGYAWSKNSGWIKFNPAQGGVLNNNGDLSGYAWGEQLGWIDFDNVFINTATGKFSGTATGTLVGTINFDCPNYCDVRTDWHPVCPTVDNAATYNAYPTCGPATCVSGYNVSVGVCVASGGGGGSGGNPTPTPTPEPTPEVETHNNDLEINPEQSGRYAKDTSNGQIVLEVPADNVPSRTTFYINAEPLSFENESLVLPDIQLIGSVFYNVFAKDQNGNYVRSFVSLLTITLPVPVNLQKARNLAVYWLNEVNNQWVLIPEAVFAKNQVTFQVNHLTKFAIFGNIEEETTLDNTKATEMKPKPSLPLPEDVKPSENLSAENNEQDDSFTNRAVKETEDIINSLVPGFLNSDNKDDPNIKKNQTEGKDFEIVKNADMIFWIFWFVIIILLFILLVKKRKAKDKNK
ncbi:MAG: Bifunctional 2',3'-cyclic nucleotide 2'-phosphodiesterase/3'-nucleotidase protein [Candidatus Falkowbacteria bacterium GW2011_GWC2_38_22]|uniref:Bifunctional 2',3'-cyclic nucleotide 2'-phosphodiesterase/3'-nucleotidase protein n=1 Tax=Candidatus Falkowbacteria bacterium GW2011_GWE1_38_31 TaxID=1618638 RepID=A0A0G0MBX5_9BACT|nr:MAG: Bifunctional 2',3'-cyclic nucleotide 2'-phosphodiesterase/3'-nucleotidase protein [Candidatus Falkowbacteria bacterium GW2011_GWF2_38_1205]KKQ61830.1 MAG: Bifunctional 2',3'-cyclic nucleotide 2'-phosphodiesterase/3'-nucleotidase protein [Candidatus Falkowbacteria bacterium GW2011_GWC2_38_22]KKQ64138.1 MAG: Bifunctional 2',3'-cyclic nucleotide 2'-phosphodiesterase/3'-nucleotidase protein [Candidatus Falkowbacteria bacterium GW2011_GWF1_38_22]KKQ66512.1 MAG: Bifunctional 2',3'-cyclic nucle